LIPSINLSATRLDTSSLGKRSVSLGSSSSDVLGSVGESLLGLGKLIERRELYTSHKPNTPHTITEPAREAG
jgi:hypothetical protein